MTTEKVKRGRGRPPVMPHELWTGFQRFFPEIRTRRGMLNKHYETEALAVIKDMIAEGVQGLEYIDNEKEEKLNSGVLRELGKLNPEDIRLYAVALCEAQKKPETKRTIRQWEYFLRDLRLRPEIIEVALSETVSDNQQAVTA